MNYDGPLLLSTTWSNGAVNGSVSRTIDGNFWVRSESVNGANIVNLTYDLDGLLTQVGALIINHDAQNGLITGSSIGGVTDDISYNGFAEPIGYTATYGAASLYQVDYVRDKLGRIITKNETVNGVTHRFNYTFDVAGRLTHVDRDGLPFSTYTFDANGNRLSYSGLLGDFTGTYDAQDRLVTYAAATYSLSYEYKADGELLRKAKTDSGGVVPSEVTGYEFDVMGNLLHVGLPDGRNIDYVVDGQNRRIGKKVNGVLVKGWLYRDQLSIAAELDGSGNVVARYVGGYMVKGGQTYRLIRDQVGSVRQVVNVSDGAVVQEINYDEFGNVVIDSNPGFQPFGFAGGLYDSDTGLVRFGARDYDPFTGRWTAKDPILFQGGDTNLYGYVLNDPINLTDPSGKIAPALAVLYVAGAQLGAAAVGLGVPYLAHLLGANNSALPGAIGDAGIVVVGTAGLTAGASSILAFGPEMLAFGLTNPELVNQIGVMGAEGAVGVVAPFAVTDWLSFVDALVTGAEKLTCP